MVMPTLIFVTLECKIWTTGMKITFFYSKEKMYTITYDTIFDISKHSYNQTKLKKANLMKPSPSFGKLIIFRVNVFMLK